MQPYPFPFAHQKRSGLLPEIRGNAHPAEIVQEACKAKGIQLGVRTSHVASSLLGQERYPTRVAGEAGELEVDYVCEPPSNVGQGPRGHIQRRRRRQGPTSTPG